MRGVCHFLHPYLFGAIGREQEGKGMSLRDMRVGDAICGRGSGGEVAVAGGGERLEGAEGVGQGQGGVAHLGLVER